MRFPDLLMLGSLALLVITGPAWGQPQGRGALWAELNLSAEQQEQLQQVRQDHQAQIAGILDETQQQQLEDLRQQGRGNGRGALGQLNLSEDQKAALRQLHEATKAEVQTILTPDQYQQLQTLRQERSQGRGFGASQP